MRYECATYIQYIECYSTQTPDTHIYEARKKRNHKKQDAFIHIIDIYKICRHAYGYVPAYGFFMWTGGLSVCAIALPKTKQTWNKNKIIDVKICRYILYL